MATITWQNASGSLGTYPAGSSISLQFDATSSDNASMVSYKLLSGKLPSGTKTNPVEITLGGLITGTFGTVDEQTTYTFTVRAYDQFGSIRDRTFSLTVMVSSVPSLVTPPGLLISVFDSVWVDKQIEYDNPLSSNTVTITYASGNLPPGLYITPEGKINGYARPPTNSVGTPITKRFTFTVQLESPLGNDSAIYTIEVFNQRITNPPRTRKPAIYNARPTYSPILDDDPYYRFYCGADHVLPTALANEYFTFKVLAVDFDGDALKYNYGKLPTGLIGDPDTGWITGIPTMDSTGINDWSFSVSVSKASKPTISSSSETFYLRTINNLVEDISWDTPENLGTIYNNTVSELFVEASSTYELGYLFESGTLPANLTVMNNGTISGRVAFQPTSSFLNQGEETEFVFTVMAYVKNQSQLRKSKTFRLTVKQYYQQPIENIYFKVTPSIQGRNVLSTLLNNENLIPTEFLYRPEDYYFGKAEDIKIVHAYGMYASSLAQYMNAIQRNHYNRNIVLGELKTAQALDENHDVVYEVVYCEIIDDLVNSSGQSIPQDITWPTPISLNLGPWTINNTSFYASSGTEYTSLSPGSVQELYPASIDNMRTEVVDNIGQNSDNLLLPRWMTSQQANGETLGFIECWVICYTLPGKSSIIKQNISENWGKTLNMIDCTIDRYNIDKTSTYNWNTKLMTPTWTELPSEIPNYTNPEQHDLAVLFPRKTILPKDNNY